MAKKKETARWPLLSGIPRRYNYDEEDRYNTFVNVDTELEGGDSQNVEVIANSNDRIDVGDLEYKEVDIYHHRQ